MRIVNKRWQYVLSVPLLTGAEDAASEAYPDPDKIDRAWIPHAFFGLCWLCAGAAQFLITPKMEGRMHKMFGYFAIVVFCCHLGSAFYALYVDALQHTIVNKLFLVNDLTEGGFYMTIGMLEVLRRKKGWLQRHKDQMFLAFVTTIEGAGTIRTISFIQYLLEKTGLEQHSFIWMLTGAGIRECQHKHKMVSTDCEWEYTFRMAWIRFLTNCYVHLYASFTPSCVKVSNDRWKSWVTLMMILAASIDMEFKPHEAFGLILLSNIYNWGIGHKAYAMCKKVAVDHVLVPIAVRVLESSGKTQAEKKMPVIESEKKQSSEDELTCDFRHTAQMVDSKKLTESKKVTESKPKYDGFHGIEGLPENPAENTPKLASVKPMRLPTPIRPLSACSDRPSGPPDVEKIPKTMDSRFYFSPRPSQPSLKKMGSLETLFGSALLSPNGNQKLLEKRPSITALFSFTETRTTRRSSRRSSVTCARRTSRRTSATFQF